MTSVVNKFSHAANHLLRPCGIRLTRALGSAAPENTLPAALARIGNLGLDIKTIIDVGASNGCWSRQARRVFLDAAILAFEPLQERWPELDAWQARENNVHLVKGAAGATLGQVSFHVADDLDGSAIGQGSENDRDLPVTTIDKEVAAAELPGPFLIKLDTHGYETPILEGAAETIKNTQALVIEVYNFRLTSHSLRFHEMCAYMGSLGFHCFDMFDVLRRPGDDALWQADFVFLRNDNPVFNKTTYR